MKKSASAKNKNPHDGSTLDDFLREEGLFEEVKAAALKRVLVLKVADSIGGETNRESELNHEGHPSQNSRAPRA